MAFSRLISRAALALLFLIAPPVSPGASVFKPGDVLTICGDSITAQGVYSVFVEDYILMCQPVGGIRTIQCGWGGTTASHLADHMKEGALTFSPTVATVYYGMNDGEMSPPSPENEAHYREGLSKVIDNFQRGGTRTVIVGSPGAVDSFYFKGHNATAEVYNHQTLQRLADIAKQVAAAKGMPFADLHTPMMETMAKAKAARGDKFAVFGEADGIHATPNGHLVMAYAFLKAMGFDGNIGTITYDAGSGNAEATEGHRLVSSKNGEVTIESMRYPYCFTHGDNHPFGPTPSILPYLSFNDELNRYMLVVKNLKSAKAKITWGKESKEFTAAQLEKGINLAAEFLDNPFAPAFAEVDKAVTAKCDFEVLEVTTYMGKTLPDIVPILPASTASFKALDAGFREINGELQEACASAVKPVTHTIKIEPLN